MADKHPFEPATGSPAATDSRHPSSSEEHDSAAQAPDVDVAALQRDRDDYYDRLLRKTAEFDNYRKRVERERREHADQAVVDLLLELLSVVDDFDRAVTVEPGDSAAGYRKGIELIHTKLHDMLRKQGLRPVPTLGTDFDPSVHQAVLHEASPEHREGEVIGEMRRGYTLGDRLLRPAMVKVAKA
jgi:molecular chaperone GrpE